MRLFLRIMDLIHLEGTLHTEKLSDKGVYDIFHIPSDARAAFSWSGGKGVCSLLP
jgi:hypothetical protein